MNLHVYVSRVRVVIHLLVRRSNVVAMCHVLAFESIQKFDGRVVRCVELHLRCRLRYSEGTESKGQYLVHPLACSNQIEALLVIEDLHQSTDYM